MPFGNATMGGVPAGRVCRDCGRCHGAIVPFPPGGAERSGFLSASTLDVMEGHRDLRKFTTGTVVAERCGVLSSGREARGDINRRRVRAQHPVVRTGQWGRAVRCSAAATDRRIDNVKRLTPWWGIESLTTLDSDQKAAEALQEAETEVGLGPMVVSVRREPRGRPARRIDRPTR
jgi:hypothetical protein